MSGCPSVDKEDISTPDILIESAAFCLASKTETGIADVTVAGAAAGVADTPFT